MTRIGFALVAAGLLAASVLPAAAAGQKIKSAVTNGTVGSVELSARRYYRRYGYWRGGPYYRGYYGPGPYYAYGPGPYYYGPRYYRPFPFSIFPFF